MKKYIVALIFLTISALVGFYFIKKMYSPESNFTKTQKKISTLSENNKIHEGDIIFQTSLSAQSKAIQLATNSKYSHCGLIYKEGKVYYVFEAVQPVKKTPLQEWIERGKNEDYVIKRLKNAESVLTKDVLQQMKKNGEYFSGKNYDVTFEWNDDKIYCSELIWKIYNRATGLEIGKLEKLKDFDLSSEIVKKKMTERYGNNIPLNETVISPKALFESDLLITVNEN